MKEQSFIQPSRKRHLNLLFHLGIWQLLHCRHPILSVYYFIHKSRGDDGLEERDREKSSLFSSAALLAGVCRTVRGLREASFPTRLMMYSNSRDAGWVLTRGAPCRWIRHQLPEESVWNSGTHRRKPFIKWKTGVTSHFKKRQLYVPRGGILFFRGHSGRRWKVQRNAWMFFGDDIKTRCSREMEAGGWKIMSNGGI